MASALANRSAARAAMGDRADALVDAKRALEIDPSNPTTRKNLDLLNAPPHVVP